jgi:hypothetical protein
MNLLLALLLQQSALKPNSWCSADEILLFNCVTKSRKTLSLCSVKGSGDESWVEYRFGKKSKTPEMVFPASKESPKQSFVRGLLTFSKGGGHWIRFNTSDARYTVFSAMGNKWEKNGVVVEPKGKPKVTVLCDSKTYQEGGPSWEELGIPEAEDPNDFELP